MKPSDETIGKFQRAWLEEFGEKIPKEEAEEELVNLANLLRIILRQISGTAMEEV